MKKVIMLVEDMYEDLEVWYPKIRLEEAGYQVLFVGPSTDKIYKGIHGYPCKADLTFNKVSCSDFSGIIIPGGLAPDALRQVPQVLKIVKEIYESGKTVGLICHGAQVAISAKILKGKKATSYIAIKDDLENAGVKWVDQAVVIDQNIVSSRWPADLAPFAKEVIKNLERAEHALKAG